MKQFLESALSEASAVRLPWRRLPPSVCPGTRTTTGTAIHDMKPRAVEGSSSEPPDWLESIGTERPLVYATYGTEAGSQAPWEAIIADLLR